MRTWLTKALLPGMLLPLLLIAVSPPGIASAATRTKIALSPAIDQIVQQVLDNISANGWNPQAQSHGRTTGGLYINWQMDNPAITNAGNTPTSHDPQVDLYYLNALAEYQTLHPQDHSYDAESQRAQIQVILDFNNYNIPKGWIYFYLLRAGLLLHNSALLVEAYLAAANYYNHWYDPRWGMIYDHTHHPTDYAVGHTIECGTALIDAGLRWNRPDWIAAGQATLTNTLVNALNPQDHLLYEDMYIASNGQQSVENDQAKSTTQSTEAQMLMTAYTLTHNPLYLSTAGTLLQSMFNSALWDHAYGGLFSALDMKSGKLEHTYKETRGQALALIALNRYNQVASQLGSPQPQLQGIQQQITALLMNNFYQSTYHGYFYRVTQTFQIYSSHPGQGIGYEDFFTTEAMGLAMDALQQTEFASLSI